MFLGAGCTDPRLRVWQSQKVGSSDNDVVSGVGLPAIHTGVGAGLHALVIPVRGKKINSVRVRVRVGLGRPTNCLGVNYR